MRPGCSQCLPQSAPFSPRLRSALRLSRVAPLLSFLLLAAASSTPRASAQWITADHWNNAPRSADTVTSSLIDKELRLGGAYLIGKGVPRDPVQAAYWYQQAAEQGDPGAQNQLGYFKLWGIGVPRDEAQALKWFTRAAGSGSQPAKLNMAVMYLRGSGTKKDVNFAAQLMTELAERGVARAQDYLGILCLHGVGVPRDAVAAEKWFNLAAKGKNPEGQYALGVLLAFDRDHEHNFPRAAKMLRSAARAGYVPAMFALGSLLVQHPEIRPARPGEGLAMLQTAAEVGSWQSSATLGFMARSGMGQPRDAAAAFRWLTIAIRQGGSVAEEKTRISLELCRAALTQEEQDREFQAAQTWLASHPHHDIFAYTSPGPAQFPIEEIYDGTPGAE